jgi:hypothetical protein
VIRAALFFESPLPRSVWCCFQFLTCLPGMTHLLAEEVRHAPAAANDTGIVALRDSNPFHQLERLGAYP